MQRLKILIVSLLVWGLFMLGVCALVEYMSAEAHAGTLDKRVKIAVVDSGVNLDKYPNLKPYICKTGSKDFTGGKNPFKDSLIIEHGTNIISILTKDLNPNKYCIVVVKYYDPKAGYDNMKQYQTALLYAIRFKIKYLNLSVSGDFYDQIEYRALNLAITKGIKVAVAAGNEEKNLDKDCHSFPACYKLTIDSDNYVVIGNKMSNYGKFVKKISYYKGGTPILAGSSESTAYYLNKWILSEK